MTTKAAKAIFGFLLAMLAFTFLSWKLDVLRTPQVLCVEAGADMVNGTFYERVVPTEAVVRTGAEAYVYVVEDSTSYFYPVVARQATVTVLDSGDGKTAIQGLYAQAQVVRFADRTLSGSTAPVRVYEEETP